MTAMTARSDFMLSVMKVRPIPDPQRLASQQLSDMIPDIKAIMDGLSDAHHMAVPAETAMRINANLKDPYKDLLREEWDMLRGYTWDPVIIAPAGFHVTRNISASAFGFSGTCEFKDDKIMLRFGDNIGSSGGHGWRHSTLEIQATPDGFFNISEWRKEQKSVITDKPERVMTEIGAWLRGYFDKRLLEKVALCVEARAQNKTQKLVPQAA